jgi:hypothetical protein
MSSRELAGLSYDTAIRALDIQERAVEQLRSRTGTLLAATSLTASFLGAQAIRYTSSLGFLGLVALIALVVSIVGCVYVLLPKKGFVFSISGPVLYESLFEFSDDPEETHRRLVYWLESYWQKNQTIIDALGRYYAVSALALTIQLLLWCAVLTDSIS